MDCRYWIVDTGPNYRVVDESGTAISPEFCAQREAEDWLAFQEEAAEARILSRDEESNADDR